MRLDKQQTFLRVNAAREQYARRLTNFRAQNVRVLIHCNRMQIDNTKNIVVQILVGDPMLDCAQIIADMKIARGLDAGKNSFLFAHVLSSTNGFMNSD